MSVWFKYPSDKDITPGHPSGSSIFAPVSGGGGGGVPAYGTVLSTAYGVDYEIGTNTYSSILANIIYTQTCDVDTKADGSGGSFVDWANATNIQYKPYGTHIAGGNAVGIYPVEVPTGSNVYYDSALSDNSEEIHDGSGGSVIIPIGFDHYYSNGTYIAFAYDNQTQVPNYTGYYFGNGTYNDYVWNGSGGYTETTNGSVYPNGTEVDGGLRYTTSNDLTEVPSSSSAYYDNGKYNQDTYYWNGSGGFYTGGLAGNPQGNYFPFGQYITDQNCPEQGMGGGTGFAYYWDGYNGWYIDTYP